MMHPTIEWRANPVGAADRAVIKTPVGKLACYAQGDVLIKTEWVGAEYAIREPESILLNQLVEQIKQFWRHELTQFKMSLFIQGTEHQQRVWRALLNIPYAETCSYKHMAENLASGARAVGNACRRNPFPLIIPCHRIVSVKGIGGYSGQTDGDFLLIKQRLLDFEAEQPGTLNHEEKSDYLFTRL